MPSGWRHDTRSPPRPPPAPAPASQVSPGLAASFASPAGRRAAEKEDEAPQGLGAVLFGNVIAFLPAAYTSKCTALHAQGVNVRASFHRGAIASVFLFGSARCSCALTVFPPWCWRGCAAGRGNEGLGCDGANRARSGTLRSVSGVTQSCCSRSAAKTYGAAVPCHRESKAVLKRHECI